MVLVTSEVWNSIMAKSVQEETYTEAETKVRAEATLKRMLATPHKPHNAAKSNGDAPKQGAN